MIATQTTLETVSGRLVDLVDPDPAAIAITDIAHALARIPRWGGWLEQPWSVADHSLLCVALAEQEGRGDLALALLLHDASEAYLGDIIRKLKDVIGPLYRPLEDRMSAAIGHALGVDADLFHAPHVKAFDDGALWLEDQQFRSARTLRVDRPDELRLEPRWLASRGTQFAAVRFVETYERLTATR